MTRTRTAFTLVELLVVISIISILMGLLIPAVNAARETARQNQCSVNVKNLALAAIQYENTKKRLPPTVDDYGYFGTPAGGPTFDPSDPGNFGGSVPAHRKIGGFGVALLPWLDAQANFEHWSQDRYPIISDGSGDTGSSSGYGTNGTVGKAYHGIAGANLAIFQCPSNPSSIADLGRNSYVQNNGLSYLNDAGVPLGVPHQDVQDTANGTGKFAYVGVGTSYLVEGPKTDLDDLKDGQGNTALYGENVQAAPWYLAGFLTGGVPNSDPTFPRSVQNLTPNFELNAGSGTDVENALLRAPYANGMVWFYEDEQGDGSVMAGSFMEKAPPSPMTGVPIAPVNPKHKINGRGLSTAEDIFTETMDDSNFFNLARPSSAHRGVVNVGFADGAVRSVNETIDYRVYQAIMTPRGKSSDVPWPEFVITDELGEG